jgi:hypothetical protein
VWALARDSSAFVDKIDILVASGLGFSTFSVGTGVSGEASIFCGDLIVGDVGSWVFGEVGWADASEGVGILTTG